MENKHEGETAVIIGNGPSLDDTPLEKLGDKYTTFGANKIYLYPFTPNYYFCVDQDMLHDCVPWLMQNDYDPDNIFLPRHIPFSGRIGLNVVIEPGFSLNPIRKVVLGGTVTFVEMQIALFMGFETVLLVGCDHRYPKTAHDGKPGSKFIAKGEDPDHFGSEYFEPGKMYNRPELDAVAKHTYPTAKIAFEQRGGKIINLTPDTALEVFEKDTWENWL
jgi:hypothetical protein